MNHFKIDCILIVMFFHYTDNYHVYFVFAYCVFCLLCCMCVYYYHFFGEIKMYIHQWILFTVPTRGRRRRRRLTCDKLDLVVQMVITRDHPPVIDQI